MTEHIDASASKEHKEKSEDAMCIKHSIRLHEADIAVLSKGVTRDELIDFGFRLLEGLGVKAGKAMKELKEWQRLVKTKRKAKTKDRRRRKDNRPAYKYRRRKTSQVWGTQSGS